MPEKEVVASFLPSTYKLSALLSSLVMSFVTSIVLSCQQTKYSGRTVRIKFSYDSKSRKRAFAKNQMPGYEITVIPHLLVNIINYSE